MYDPVEFPNNEQSLLLWEVFDWHVLHAAVLKFKCSKVLATAVQYLSKCTSSGQIIAVITSATTCGLFRWNTGINIPRSIPTLWPYLSARSLVLALLHGGMRRVCLGCLFMAWPGSAVKEAGLHVTALGWSPPSSLEQQHHKGQLSRRGC